MKGIDAPSGGVRLKSAGGLARLSDRELHDPVREMR
jgi:hypothetical protein